MNLRPGHKEDSVEVNLTPLIDVVFLLLIFFMVSTTFDRHAKLKVSLPEATTKATQQQNDPLVLSIDAKGNYFLNEHQVVNQQLGTLKQAILKTLGEKNVNIKDVSLVLRADANTPHQSVVRAMDAASQLGLTRLSIATVESK
jgi:biopolymer transport protein ExbD